MTGRSLANDFQFNKLKYKQHLQFIYLLFLVYFSSVYLPVIVSFLFILTFFSLIYFIFINFIFKIIIKLTTLHINRNYRLPGKIHTGSKINKNDAMVVATITCNKYLEKAALTN